MPMVMKAFNSGAGEVRIPPGDYRFGQERYQGAKAIFPLGFENMQRDADHPFVIDATGATFWFDLDDKQMPPTRFFQRMTEESEDAAPEEEDALDARDVESILGLANARGIPTAMLRWHYRSRHESLIATSNAEFYENRLLVLPSPRPAVHPWYPGRNPGGAPTSLHSRPAPPSRTHSNLGVVPKEHREIKHGHELTAMEDAQVAEQVDDVS
jgi:hypothetical protein